MSFKTISILLYTSANPFGLKSHHDKDSTSDVARPKNPPSRGAGCALQQECRRGSKPRQLPATKHFENPSIIFHCSLKVTNNSKLQVSYNTWLQRVLEESLEVGAQQQQKQHQMQFSDSYGKT